MEPGRLELSPNGRRLVLGDACRLRPSFRHKGLRDDRTLVGRAHHCISSPEVQQKLAELKSRLPEYAAKFDSAEAYQRELNDQLKQARSNRDTISSRLELDP